MKKNFLYVCATNYTLMNCINAVYNDFQGSRGNSDIIIFCRTDDMRLAAVQLKKTNLFRKIFVYKFINEISSTEKARVMLDIGYLNRKYVIDTPIGGTEKYDVLISQSMFYIVLLQRTFKCSRVYLIEEGLSSYTGRTAASDRRSPYYNIFVNLFLGKKYTRLDGELLYDLNLFQGNSGHLYALNKIDEHLLKKLEQIFLYKEEDQYAQNTIIYMGSPLERMKNLLNYPQNAPDDFVGISREIITDFFKYFGNEKIVYRKHPIEKVSSQEYGPNMLLDSGNNMWEIECGRNVTDESILVSFFSTACCTPKLLFDKEPYLIFLYKQTGQDFYNAEKVISDLKAIYREPSKILEVKSMAEYEQICDWIKKKVKCDV